jgi:hypothetical protein
MRVELPGVLVATHLVGSSDFRTRVGAVMPLALEVYSRHRTPARDDDRRRPVLRRTSGTGSPDTFDLTGVVVPFAETCRLGGWVAEVAGVPFFVTEADHDPGVGPEGPQPGSWVRVRGEIYVADDYVVDEVEEALRQGVRRLWQVRRIIRSVPVDGGRGARPREVAEIRHTGDVSSYLIDLVTAD